MFTATITISDILDLLGNTLNWFSPFLLLFVSTWLARQDQKRERRERERENAISREKEEAKERHRREEERFLKIESRLDELTNSIEEVKNDKTIAEMDEKMTHVIQLNESFLTYTTSLASLITSIGRGVLSIENIDPAVAESIKESIDNQEKIDSALKVQLYKLIY